MNPYFNSEYMNERTKNKAICIVDAGGATAGTATCDYEYNEIHYHININLPENINPEALRQVLAVLRNPDQPPSSENTSIEVKKTRAQRIAEKFRSYKND